MPIIRSPGSPTLADMKPGEYFRIMGCPTLIRCRAVGNMTNNATAHDEIPTVIIIDADQHETQGSYVQPGHVSWHKPGTPVQRLELVKTPEYLAK